MRPTDDRHRPDVVMFSGASVKISALEQQQQQQPGRSKFSMFFFFFVALIHIKYVCLAVWTFSSTGSIRKLKTQLARRRLNTISSQQQLKKEGLDPVTFDTKNFKSRSEMFVCLSVWSTRNIYIIC